MKKKQAAKNAPVAQMTTYRIEKPQLMMALFDVEIAGDRLLCNRLDESAISGYGETAIETGSARRVAVSEETVFERSKYMTADGQDGFPLNGVFSAIRDAAVVTAKEISKAASNRAINLVGPEIIPLKFKKCELHKSIGRNSGMTRAPRLVIRPLYLDWSLSFQARLMVNEINPSQLYSLIVLAGQCIGIGNWRPGTPKGGSFGCWEIKNFSQATDVNAAAAE